MITFFLCVFVALSSFLFAFLMHGSLMLEDADYREAQAQLIAHCRRQTGSTHYTQEIDDDRLHH